MTHRFTLLLVVAAALPLSLASCGSAPKGSVSAATLVEIRDASHEVRPGMSKSAVFDAFKGSNLVRLSSTQIETATIEEWKAEAFHDSSRGRDLTVAFLYFRDEVLVDVSDTRIDFRRDAAILDRWAQPAPGK